MCHVVLSKLCPILLFKQRNTFSCCRCLESIIGEQLKKIRHSLADILTLDTAAASATDRLSVVRASMRNGSNKPKKVVSLTALFFCEHES